MTYDSGQPIEAINFNNQLAYNVNLVWNYGDGGSYGYGQTAANTVVAGGQIQAAHYNDLLTKIYAAYRHQNSGNPPPSLVSAVSSGSTIGIISNLTGTSGANGGTIANIQANRLNGVRGTATSSSSKTATSWQGTNAVIEYNINFTSYDALRYFFNCNGFVQFTVSYNNASNTKNSDWNTIISTNLAQFTIYNNAIGTTGAAQNQNAGITSFYGIPNNNINYNIKYYTAPNYGTLCYGYTYVRINGGVFTVGIGVVDGNQLSWVDGADTIVGTLSTTVSFTPPSTAYLSASWGTPNIT